MTTQEAFKIMREGGFRRDMFGVIHLKKRELSDFEARALQHLEQMGYVYDPD